MKFFVDRFQPGRFDIERQVNCRGGISAMQILVRFPGTEKNGVPFVQRKLVPARPKGGIHSSALEDQLALRMGMDHKRLIHIQQRQAAEISLNNSHGPSHLKSSPVFIVVDTACHWP